MSRVVVSISTPNAGKIAELFSDTINNFIGNAATPTETKTILTQFKEKILPIIGKPYAEQNTDEIRAAIEYIRKQLLATLSVESNNDIKAKFCSAADITLNDFIRTVLGLIAQTLPINEICPTTGLPIDPITYEGIAPDDQLHTQSGWILDIQSLLEHHLLASQGYHVHKQDGSVCITQDAKIIHTVTNTVLSKHEIVHLIVTAKRVGLIDQDGRYCPKRESAKKHLEEVQAKILRNFRPQGFVAQREPKPFVAQTLLAAIMLFVLFVLQPQTYAVMNGVNTSQDFKLKQLDLLFTGALFCTIAYKILPVIFTQGIKGAALTLWRSATQHLELEEAIDNPEAAPQNR